MPDSAKMQDAALRFLALNNLPAHATNVIYALNYLKAHPAVLNDPELYRIPPAAPLEPPAPLENYLDPRLNYENAADLPILQNIFKVISPTQPQTGITDPRTSPPIPKPRPEFPIPELRPSQPEAAAQSEDEILDQILQQASPDAGFDISDLLGPAAGAAGAAVLLNKLIKYLRSTGGAKTMPNISQPGVMPETSAQPNIYRQIETEVGKYPQLSAPLEQLPPPLQQLPPPPRQLPPPGPNEGPSGAAASLPDETGTATETKAARRIAASAEKNRPSKVVEKSRQLPTRNSNKAKSRSKNKTETETEAKNENKKKTSAKAKNAPDKDTLDEAIRLLLRRGK